MSATYKFVKVFKIEEHFEYAIFLTFFISGIFTMTFLLLHF